MKVVVNSRFLTQPTTGVQRFAAEISKGLKQIYGDEVTFVCPQDILNKELAEQLEAVTTGKNQGHLWEQIDLPRYLAKIGKPLLLNLANTGPLFYSNKISTIHDVAFLTYPKTFSRSFVWFYRALIPGLIKTSRHLFTVSEFSKTEIMKFYKISGNKISVIYNAVDDTFKPTADQYLLSKNYFVAVSSLNHRKNLLSTLRSFDELYTDQKDIYLYIIGDFRSDSFKDVNLKEFKKHPNIVFCGRVTDEELIKYYSNAIGFVFPSYYEGFGIPPLEAQACNCPVIVSEVSSLPEIFQNSAMYCSPYSITSITEALQKLITDKNLRLELISKGKLNLKRYSWNLSVEKILQKIEKINYEKGDNT